MNEIFRAIFRDVLRQGYIDLFAADADTTNKNIAEDVDFEADRILAAITAAGYELTPVVKVVRAPMTIAEIAASLHTELP